MKNRIIALVGGMVLLLCSSLFAQTKPYWKRLGYCIEYKGGLCWGGNYLKASGSDKCLTSLDSWYGINSLEGSILFPMRNDKYIKVGIEYGWANLTDRAGLPVDTLPYSYGWDHRVSTSHEWKIRKYGLNLERQIKHYATLGAEFTYGYGEATEYFSGEIYDDTLQQSYWVLKDSAFVRRQCIGMGIYLRFLWNRNLTDHISVNPFLLTKLSVASEISNNVPWPYSRNGILKIHYSGFYAGVNLIFGI